MRLTVLLLFFVPLALTAQEWEIITLAGTGEPGFSGDGGLATEAKINNPFGVTVVPDGNVYF